MSPFEQSSVPTAERHAWFQTTHWSVVLRAGLPDSAEAQAALANLCQTYWYPLYVFIRCQRHTPEDAQDLVQGFFAQVLQKNYFQDAVREKGKFRTFLLLALKRFMANEWDRANRLKRGGGWQIISLDEKETENRYRAEPVDESSPEKAFDRQWALTLLEKVLKRLESEFSLTHKRGVFEQFKGFLSGERSANSYAEVSQMVGMTEGTVKVMVHRLRRRYRELLREEIANTVASPQEVQEEIRNIFAALS